MRSPRETEYLNALVSRLQQLIKFLAKEKSPSHVTSLQEWHRYLAAMKSIVGNASNDMSFVAALMAKDYLCTVLPMADFDVGLKAQGAPGLDIDERTVDGRRVIAEIKTTTPYGEYDLGAQQKAMFKKDFSKLNAASADLKYFFVIDRTAFTLMQRKYAREVPTVTVVLLPDEAIAPTA